MIESKIQQYKTKERKYRSTKVTNLPRFNHPHEVDRHYSNMRIVRVYQWPGAICGYRRVSTYFYFHAWGYY